MKLTAEYKVPLTGFLMFCLDEHSLNTISFNMDVDEYSIKIVPEIDKSHTYKQEDDKHPTYGANELIVSITKEVEGTIDEIRKKAWPIVEAFEQAAETAINRFISFFQYQLNIPLLKKVNRHDDPWSNLPKLKDENGKNIDLNLHTDDYSRYFAYGYFPAFGMKALCNLEDQALLKALNNPTQPKLHEEFLCSARTEIIEGNYRRAVLEMAISCEVFVKSSLFSESPISGAIFNFLSSNRKIEVTVQELLNNPVKEALGSSFKEDYEQHWKNIGYLFQTRNKIAHSGICRYKKDNKKDKGKVFEVDEEVLNEWWESLEALFSWMAEKNQ